VVEEVLGHFQLGLLVLVVQAEVVQVARLLLVLLVQQIRAAAAAAAEDFKLVVQMVVRVL
jgi:hypothetical protein